jgi:hypothetical protein
MVGCPELVLNLKFSLPGFQLLIDPARYISSELW